MEREEEEAEDVGDQEDEADSEEVEVEVGVDAVVAVVVEEASKEVFQIQDPKRLGTSISPPTRRVRERHGFHWHGLRVHLAFWG